MTACGLNGAGALREQCDDGDWHDTSVCVDPDECVNDDVRAGQACGLNGNGTYVETCVSGQWSITSCDDPDECQNGDTQPGNTPCGPADAGLYEERCAGGAWEETSARVSITSPDFVYIPPSTPDTFTLGSPEEEPGRQPYAHYFPETQHEVEITRGFWMQRTEVTQAQFGALAFFYPSDYGDSSHGTFPPDRDIHPVEDVTWFSAAAYANALSAAEGLPACYDFEEPCLNDNESTPYLGTGSLKCAGVSFEGLDCTGYRLPTQAEWEYAARAGTTTATYATETQTLSDIAACYEPFEGNWSLPVATRAPNAWGLYDMLGNVYEWTGDWYGPYQDTAVIHVDPLGPDAPTEEYEGGGVGRVARGGDVFPCDAEPTSPGLPRTALRLMQGPDVDMPWTGFRPVRTAF